MFAVLIALAVLGYLISPLWILPLVALLAGIWIVGHAYLTRGPIVTVSFDTAEGLEAGKTKIRYRNVDVGTLETVELRDDMSGIVVAAELDPQVRELLREDTQFWVVRARVGKGGLSGIGTLLSGAYIQLAPGNASGERLDFIGLEEPPPIPSGTPGRRITLVSDRNATLNAGDPLFYKGLKAGQIESADMDLESDLIRYSAFVNAPYDTVLSTSTRFWNVGGITVKTGAAGVELNVPPFESLLLGGAAFENFSEPGALALTTDGAEYRLLASRSEVTENPYSQRVPYVLEFDGSVAGLSPGAPVYFRGILVGHVERLLIAEVSAREVSAGNYGQRSKSALPVLINLEPGRFEIGDTPSAVEILEESLVGAVSNGLRATLSSSNLLTGQRSINLDYYPTEDPKKLGSFGAYTTIPTTGSGLNQIQQRIDMLLGKIDALPLEQSVASLNELLVSVNTAVESFNTLLNAQGMASLPADLDATLVELRDVLDGFSQDSDLYRNMGASMESLETSLDSLDRLIRKLSDQPSSLLSSPPVVADPIPEPRP